MAKNQIPKRIGLVGLALLCATVFLFFAAIILFWFEILAANDLIHDVASPRWPSTTGMIISSSVAEWQESSDTFYEPKVKYGYVVEGRGYSSKRLRFGDFVPSLPGNLAEATEIAVRYRPGDPVRVYYHPNDPRLSVLEPGAGKIRLVLRMGFGLVMLFIFIGLAISVVNYIKGKW